MTTLWPERPRPTHYAPLARSTGERFWRPAERVRRLESWLWARRPLYALFGWVCTFWSEDDDELGAILKFMALVTAAALAFALGAIIGSASELHAILHP